MNNYMAVMGDYMELGHKVTFDYVTRLIHVAPSVTSLDIKVDLYSDMKEWFLLANRKNRGFLPPIRVIGGDNTVAGQKAGDIYFTQNGWRVVYDPTRVSVTGVLFSDDFDTPWLSQADFNLSGILKPVYPALVSSLVTGIDIAAVTAPSASTVAQAVWQAAASVGGAGTHGEANRTLADNVAIADAVRAELTPELALVDVAISSRATQTSVNDIQSDVTNIDATTTITDAKVDIIDGKVDSIQTDTTNIQIDVAAVQGDVGSILVTVGNMSALIDDLIKYQRNKSVIDPTAFTLTIYEDDGVTPLTIFDLQDSAGVASVTSIFKRIPR